MGDFNDDPHDDSMKKILNAKKHIKDVEENGIYNPSRGGYGHPIPEFFIGSLSYLLGIFLR